MDRTSAESICFLSGWDIAEMVRSRAVSPVEVLHAVLDRIARVDGAVNAYVTLTADEAIQAARTAEQKVMAGEELGPLHGVPVAIKDLEPQAGVRTTFGSKPLSRFVPRANGTNVERLRAAGAILIGTTNTPEFGHKGTTDNFIAGPTSTPFQRGHNAGGSSGGSAAAVAAGMAPIAHGTDGGGSIRIPAALCGVYGLKPSYGRVPRVTRPDGFLSNAPFGVAGPLTRTVQDAALMLGVLSGAHPRDPFCLPTEERDDVAYIAATSVPIAGLRVAYSPNLDVFPVEPAIANAINRAVGAFEDLGADVEQVRLGIMRSQAELCETWMTEFSLQLAILVEGFERQGIDLMGAHRAELVPEVVSMTLAAYEMSALEYKRHDTIRTEVFDAVQDVFEHFDLLVTPTLAVASVSNSDDGNTLGPGEVCGEATDPRLGWCLTYPFNLTGHPAASVPVHVVETSTPTGMQIVGRRFADTTVLSASAAFERAMPWAEIYDARPPVWVEAEVSERRRNTLSSAPPDQASNA